MKKVLIVAYLYPPAGGVGAHRITKYVKYLPGTGWQPHVLTVKEKFYELVDPALGKDIPDTVTVSRTGTLNCSRLVKRFAGSPYTLAGLDQDNNKRTLRGKFKPPLLRLLKLLSHHIFVPDYEVGWLPFGILRGINLFKKCPPDVLFITGSPYSSFLIGLILRKAFSVPLVIDLRDAWTLNVWRMKEKTPLKRSIEGHMEHIVVKNAARVICVQPDMCEDYRNEYPRYANKFVTITNGFDADDFRNLQPCNRDDEGFRIIYTGRLPRNCGLEPFLEAVKILQEMQPKIIQNLKIFFVGELDGNKRQLIKSMGLDEYVRCVGYVSHHRCLSYMKSADLLLILGRDENDRAMLPAKVFEYLATGKPILALMSSNSAAAEVVRKACNFKIVDNTENASERVVEAILATYHESKQEKKGWNRQGIEQFARSRLTQQLAEVLDTVCDERKSSIA